jgi:hypothetical protein
VDVSHQSIGATRLVCAFGELLCHHQYLRHHTLSEIASVPSRQAAETGRPPACAAADHLLLPRTDNSTRVLKCYPADAVQADHPFPFSNGWMTVAAASDFQSRPAILCDNLASYLSNSGSGITPRNLEHRRVNVRSRNQTISESLKSRWSRVERKALVFFPTLNERLSALKELFPQRRPEFAL